MTIVYLVNELGDDEEAESLTHEEIKIIYDHASIDMKIQTKMQVINNTSFRVILFYIHCGYF